MKERLIIRDKAKDEGELRWERHYGRTAGAGGWRRDYDKPTACVLKGR